VLVVIAVVVVAIVGAVTFVVIDDNSTTSSTSAVQETGKASIDGVATVGEQAPDFQLRTLDGKTVRLSDFAGTPVVVNFWASYCHPCREEFPMFRKSLAQHGNDFVLLGIDYRDIASDARKFAKDKHATWPILKDPDNALALAYGVRAVPQTFFIDRAGKISQRYYAQVPDDLFEQELAKISKPAAGTTTPTTPPT
jgi:cytochrome c biogenesis protein CcmG/thiol:disulfide interchange protein DsbE